MKQSRLVSFIETILNTIIGLIVSFIGWPIAAILCGVEYTGTQHLFIVGFFTVLSVLRGYVIRRFFNAGLHMAAVKIAYKFKHSVMDQK